MSRRQIREAMTSVDASPVDGQPGKFLVQIATPGWGASGYYSPEVLEAAAKAKIFPAGTQMYLDHEMADGSGLDERGNRSVKDLAAAFESDATWDGQKLSAVATVFSPYRKPLAEMKDSIGLSMRAWADVTIGSADGRTGTIVNELVEAQSVDFVTRAGRGGKILQVIESAKADARAEFSKDLSEAMTALKESRNIGQWIESRLHLRLTCIGDDMYGDGFLTRDERIALSGAVGDALDTFAESLQASAPQLYQRDLWDDPAVLAAQVEESLNNVPVNPAGRNNNPREPIMGTIQVDEADHRRVTEAAGRVPVIESERDTAIRERDEARAESAQLCESNAATERTTKARSIIESQSDGKAEFSALEIAGLTASLPLTESGALDEAKFTATVDGEIAKAAEAAGAGGVVGFGGQTTKVAGEPSKLTESEYDKARAGVFGRKTKVS
jgi:hypothetical protein